MEPEPTLSTLLKAIAALTSQVGSLQDQVKSRASRLSSSLPYARKPTTLLVTKTKEALKPSLAHQLGLSLPPHTGGETHTPGTVRPGLKAPFRPSRGTGFDSEEEEEPRRVPKKEPQGMPGRHLGSLTPLTQGPA
ncbi:hypothetical protein RHS01_05307 [Rhizoctonia solani]|uniref:Uncharacterized protein n=1 Tax=Rhizoctonia solani TaxID=456999 RepID=A0A8H7M1Q6_9AGAM|nr:hypothetical protein RHS01_05307 [Rhizoctonia solani]